jgi:acetyl-CoA carboxylase biotin carboxyl carrier protein
MDEQKKPSWLERIEDIIAVLEGSSIGELELSEGGTEIIIRRTPGMVLVSAPSQAITSGSAEMSTLSATHAPKSEGVAIIAPMTGVYYSAASPTSPPFVTIGDIVRVGQIIALIEAMKVFNEVQAEVAGRVLALVANNGDVVQKGNVLLRVEPL